MLRSVIISGLILTWLLMANPAGGQSPRLPDNTSTCSLAGWVSQTTAELNVYAGPSENAGISATLPAMSNNEDGLPVGIEVDILASHQGWLKIDHARDVPELTSRPARSLFSGSGWVKGSSISFAVQADKGHLEPDADSPVLIDLNGEWLTEMGHINAIVACKNEWALLDFQLDPVSQQLVELAPERQPASHGQAWFNAVCPLQETSCDEN